VDIIYEEPPRKPLRVIRWKWVWRDASKTERLYAVGIEADGTLFNPNGYPENIVRAACLATEARRHERRSQAAKEAAKTRDKRKELRVWETAKRIVAEEQTGPREHCYVCGRYLTDPESIARGIGSECWQHVLEHISAIKACEDAP
jgi:hypothetical protein